MFHLLYLSASPVYKAVGCRKGIQRDLLLDVVLVPFKILFVLWQILHWMKILASFTERNIRIFVKSGCGLSVEQRGLGVKYYTYYLYYIWHFYTARGKLFDKGRSWLSQVRSQLQQGEEGAQPGAGPGGGVRALPWHELRNLSPSSSKTKCPLEAVVSLESIQE